MMLKLNEDLDLVLNRNYNVEYLDGRNKCNTFNNKLVNIDSTYFWFSSKEKGLALVRQDRITFMYCTDKPYSEEPIMGFNSYMTRERINKINDYFKWRNKTFSIKDSLIKTCRYFNLYYSHDLYNNILNNVNTTEDNFMKMYLRCIDNLLQYKDKNIKDSSF